MESKEFIILSGNSHPELANLVASRLSIRLGNVEVYHKSNRETMVSIHDSVRAKDVYVLQTGLDNNAIMEMLILAYACKTSSAKKIVGVLPYLPYSKQCKMRKRGCIVTKLLAKMMCKAGFTHIITMDLHSKEIQGFFDCPVDNLRASPFLIFDLKQRFPDYRNTIIVVARNPVAAKRATSYADRLRVPIAVIHGEVKEEEMAEVDVVDGRYSPPISLDDENSTCSTGGAGAGGEGSGCGPPPPQLSTPTSSRRPSASLLKSRIMELGGASVAMGMPRGVRKEKPPLTVVGDVSNKIAVIVDDLIDDARAFIAAAEALKEKGAKEVVILCTHGLMSSDAPNLLEATDSVDLVVVTNTIPHDAQKLQCVKIKTVDISVLLAEAIRRIHHSESMSFLFRDVSGED